MRNRGSAQSLLVSATDLSISPSAARRVTAVHLPFKLRSGLMLLKEQLKLEKKKKKKQFHQKKLAAKPWIAINFSGEVPLRTPRSKEPPEGWWPSPENSSSLG